MSTTRFGFRFAVTSFACLISAGVALAQPPSISPDYLAALAAVRLASFALRWMAALLPVRVTDMAIRL